MSENATRKAFTLCAPHCGNNPCSFEVELSGKEIRSFKSHPKMRFKPCIKGFQIPGRYAHPDRLLHPMRRVGPKGSGPDGGNRFERISWDEALDLVAQGLEAAKEKGGNESVIMYNYAGQHTLPGGKDAGPATILRLLNLWGGAVPAYERGSLCWKAFQMGTKDVFGHWQFRLRDTEKCDWIIIWGNNPVETAYRGHLQALQAAKRPRDTIHRCGPGAHQNGRAVRRPPRCHSALHGHRPRPRRFAPSLYGGERRRGGISRSHQRALPGPRV